MEGWHTILGGLLGNWLVGPIWGANLVLFPLVVSAISSRPGQGINRYLILYTVAFQLLVSTAHAGASLTDLIVCFTMSAKPAQNYFSDEGRPALLVQLVLYTINVHIGDYFIVWRVWVLWGRHIALVAPFLFLNVCTSILGFMAIAALSRMHHLSDPRVRFLTASAWIISLAVQGIGTLLIAWRVWSTPTVSVSSRSRWNPWTLLWVLVESGSLYSAMTLFAIALTVTDSSLIDVAVAPLCHVAAFVPLTIILREHYKTTPRTQMPLTLPSTTFLVDERELETRYDGRKTPVDTMTIEVETSTHERIDIQDVELDVKRLRKLQKKLPVL